MIYNIGTDIIEISRIEKSLENPRFLEKFFSNYEKQVFLLKSFAPQTVAVNFCGKEAFSKSLGTGVSGFSLNEVSILRDDLNAPYIFLEGRAKDIAVSKNLDFKISLSHSKEYATATVISFYKN